MLLILFHGTEFREFASIFVPQNGIPSCFLPCNGLEQNSESFLFHGTAGVPPEQTNFSIYSVFRGIIFLSEVVNPTTAASGWQKY